MTKSLLPQNDVKHPGIAGFLISHPTKWIVGLDEVGAGCLAGPLCVAAFAFPVDKAKEIKIKTRVNDSKLLTPEKRCEASELLKVLPHCFYKTLWIEIPEIETINIYWARMKAFWSLILEIDDQLEGSARFLVDGPQLSRKHGATPTIDELDFMEIEKRILAQSKADSSFFAVAAASIIAKVERDTFMAKLSQDFSHYAWEKNKGYATGDHIEAIKNHGMCEHHRPSFCKNFSVQF
jgi:ribonuclease HII